MDVRSGSRTPVKPKLAQRSDSATGGRASPGPSGSSTLAASPQGAQRPPFLMGKLRADELRERIAALRRAAASTKLKADESIGDADAHGESNATKRTPAAKTRDESGLPTLEEAIAQAKLTGRLHVLDTHTSNNALPAEIFQNLLPRGSPYVSRRPACQSANTSLDLAMDSSEDDAKQKWWEVAELKALTASNGSLTVIDEAIAGFPCLEILDLHNNHISSPLPASMCRAASLTTLNLSRNRLSEFPVEICGLVNLQILNLANNHLHSLWPTSWSNLVSLCFLSSRKRHRSLPVAGVSDQNEDTSFRSDASFASFETEDTTAPSTAELLPRLLTLDLSHNELQTGAFTSTTLLPNSLLHLNAAHNRITGDLPLTMFASLQYLKTLDVSENQIEAIVASIPCSETRFPCLEKLELGKNRLTSVDGLSSWFDGRSFLYQGAPKSSVEDALQCSTSGSQMAIMINVAGNPLNARTRSSRIQTAKASIIVASNSTHTSDQDSEAKAGLEATQTVHRLYSFLARQTTVSNRPEFETELRILTGSINAFLSKFESEPVVPTRIIDRHTHETPARRRNRNTEYAWQPL